MLKDADEHLKNLVERVSSAIQQSGLLTDKVLAYIESALFTPDPEALINFITDDSDCERDTLLDLIFSPGQDVQRSLESLLEKYSFSSDDERLLSDRLTAREIIAPIRMPDNMELVNISVPGYIKSQYLRRLNISWQLDSCVISAIRGSVTQALWPVIKVKLRNTGIRPNPEQLTFLCRFFEKMEDKDPEYPAYLDLILTLPAATADTGDMYEHLTEYKRSLFRILQQTKRFETLLNRSNMETLMLQGIIAPHACAGRLVHQMELVDRICYGIFGKTEIIAEPLEEPVRHVSDPTNPEEVVRSLLR